MQAHHAYVYEGPSSLLEPLAKDARVRFGFTDEADPDVRVELWEKFGIEESRALVERMSLRTTQGRALHVLCMVRSTSDAQQALLKLFEEPAEGVVFVLLVPHGMLLPTLRSRFLEYPENISRLNLDMGGGQEISTAQEFLAWPYAKRSAWITAFIKGDDDGGREKVRNFINALEAELYARLANKPQDVQSGLQDIARFRAYLADSAPSVKMILEHFAATLPILK